MIGNKSRIGLVIVSILAGCFAFTLGCSSDAEKPNPTTSQDVSSSAQQAPEKNPQPEIQYDIVQRWTIPNGGEGKAVVISPTLVNEATMPQLGEKLKKDVSKDRNAVIMVFTSREAAGLRDKVFADKASKEELALYDKSYVGQYTKNGNTGFHQFLIYFDGVNGANTKTIKY